MTAKQALVTGGAGFIGSHLVDALLARAWRVCVLDDLSTGDLANLSEVAGRPGLRFHEGSVLDPRLVDQLVRESDVVFHLAAAVGVRLIVARPLESLMTNIRGTEHVLEAGHTHRKKVLLTSTSEIYGKSPNAPFREDDDRVLGPTNRLRWSYATSKAVEETLAHAYHKELGLPTIVVRLFNVVGPRQKSDFGMVLPRFIKQALAGEPLTVYGDGTQSRVFTYAGDAVEAMIRLTETPAADGGIFNVAGHESITINDLATLVIEASGSRSIVRFVPFEEVYGRGFDDMVSRTADTSRLESTAGYRCATPLIDCVIAAINWARASTRAAANQPVSLR